MAIDTINIGTTANDGSGDPLRTAFTKINTMFTELYGTSGEGVAMKDDETPQLGGDLDVLGRRITSTRSNEDIVILPNGTGGVVASGIRLAGTQLSADDSSAITIAEALQINGATNIDGAVTATSTLTVTGATTVAAISASGAATFTGGVTAGAVTTNAITSNGSNADLSIQPSGTGDVVISALRVNGTTLDSSDSSAININEGLIVDGTLITSGALTASGLSYPTSDGDAGQFLKTNGSGTLSFASVSIGDLSIIGATIAAPSNAPLTLVSSGSSVDIEGLSITGNVISTTDSSAGVEVTGNLIPSADGVYQLGSSSKRWQTAYLSAETLDIGGATISSDGTGSIAIAATGATLPSGSKVGTQALMLGGKTTGSSGRPVQLVEIFVSDGSTVRTDAQILATTADLELEFNGTVDDVPVYTEANQTFTLASGATLASNQTGVTLFQF